MHLHHTGSLPVGSPYFAELIQASRTSSVDTIDRLLSRLQGRKDEWVRLSIPERLSLLDEVRKDVYRLKERWVQAELEAKGIQAGTLPEAEEWVILATVFRALRKHRRSLVEIQARGRPQIPGRIVERPDGQVIAPVFPHEVSDRLLFRGVSAEVWMEPGVTAEEVLNTQAAAYRDQDRVGQVAFILGAGNASVLPVTDLLHKLFVELRVAVVKLNPVNAHMGPLMEEGFRALVERGFLGFVYGGVEEGAYLVNHPAVDELHLTGSDKTYEAVVFGSGPEGVRRKAERQPLVTKRFTGELGNVSPVIVVPGPWQPADIQEQAVQIASWLVANAGFACLTPRVIVQHQSWPGRGRLLDEVGRWLERYPTTPTTQGRWTATGPTWPPTRPPCSTARRAAVVFPGPSCPTSIPGTTATSPSSTRPSAACARRPPLTRPTSPVSSRLRWPLPITPSGEPSAPPSSSTPGR